MRVLITTPPVSRPGGVAEYLRLLRPHLPDTVDYLTVGSRIEGEGLWTTLSRLVRDSWRFGRAVACGNYDLVHLNPSIGPKALVRDGILLLIAKSLGKAVVVFAHGWDPRCEQALGSYCSRPFRWVFGRADSFIVLGSGFKASLRVLGYKRAVFVEAAPVEEELLRYTEPLSPPVPAGERFTILFLARIEKEKGIYEALEAYRLVKRGHPCASLVVAGEGGELGRVVRHASASGLSDIVFTGHVRGAEKYELFRAADAYLFPSHSEGLPLSVLEAMAAGLPVITSAVGGLCDFFEDGAMGFITKRPDPETLATLLGQLINNRDLCSRIGAFNREYARNHFRGPDVAARIEGIYRFVLEGAH